MTNVVTSLIYLFIYLFDKQGSPLGTVAIMTQKKKQVVSTNTQVASLPKIHSSKLTQTHTHTHTHSIIAVTVVVHHATRPAKPRRRQCRVKPSRPGESSGIPPRPGRSRGCLPMACRTGGGPRPHRLASRPLCGLTVAEAMPPAAGQARDLSTGGSRARTADRSRGRDRSPVGRAGFGRGPSRQRLR